jgi:hypothetical protein
MYRQTQRLSGRVPADGPVRLEHELPVTSPARSHQRARVWLRHPLYSNAVMYQIHAGLPIQESIASIMDLGRCVIHDCMHPSILLAQRRQHYINSLGLPPSNNSSQLQQTSPTKWYRFEVLKYIQKI